jgi:hypothetical protein
MTACSRFISVNDRKAGFCVDGGSAQGVDRMRALGVGRRPHSKGIGHSIAWPDCFFLPGTASPGLRMAS